MKRICAAAECDRPRGRDHVFCRRCWSRVPEPLKVAIYEAYRDKDRAGWFRAVRAARSYLIDLRRPTRAPKASPQVCIPGLE